MRDGMLDFSEPDYTITIKHSDGVTQEFSCKHWSAVKTYRWTAMGKTLTANQPPQGDVEDLSTVVTITLTD